MTPAPIILERIVRVPSLGIRFFDTVSGRYISDLTVTAFAAGDRYAPGRSLLANQSGVFALHDDIEPPKRYSLTVRDSSHRFIPFTLNLDLPIAGLHADVQLFSSPERRPAEGLAAVYASLLDGLSDRPSQSAILEVRYAGQLLGRGLADQRGEVVAIVPYPPPLGSLLASPLGSPPDAVDQPWLVDSIWR